MLSVEYGISPKDSIAKAKAYFESAPGAAAANDEEEAPAAPKAKGKAKKAK